MPDFKVHSPFVPGGDQPTAIDTIVQSLEAGHRYTTLLGATGTGKSIGYNDPVFVVKRVGSSTTPMVTRIGPLVDGLLKSQSQSVTRQDDTEVLDRQSLKQEYFAQAFNPYTGIAELYPIQSFIRHATPAKMYRLTTKCGRTVTLTGDHNLWVLRNGDLKLIDTADALTTDFVPLPGKLLAEGNTQTLNVLSELAGRRLFVNAADEINAYVKEEGNDEIASILDTRGINSYNKLYANKRYLSGRGIDIDLFTKVLEGTQELGGKWNANAGRMGGKRDHNSLPARLAFTPEFMQLLGIYIAEGHAEKRYITLTSYDSGIRSQIENALNQLGIPFFTRKSSNYQVSSAALTELLRRLCGTHSRDKHLPYFWPQLDASLLSMMLRAYFDGDGTVGRASDLSATTASHQLASDLTYALLRFGIWARITRRWKRATTTDHAGDWYYYVTISGQENLSLFSDRIGFSIRYKQDRLNAQMQRPGNSNVDIVPITGQDLRQLRHAIGLSAKTLGQRADLSRAAVQLIERNQRKPQRTSLVRLLDVLRISAVEKNMPEAWWQTWEKIQRLCHLHWTPIAKLEQVEYTHPHVYDFCVPGAETFLAGHGGLFVHNTFTISKVIERTQRPTLVMAHNKTLAAQLYSEFKEFFPDNGVEYFVSYYDYYQPEAYVPRHDLYIEKDSSINDEIDRLRLAATSSLMSRRDVIIVASVSCIYGIGDPETYGRFAVRLKKGETRRREVVLRMLVAIQYERNDVGFGRSKFRVRGDTLEVQPAYTDTAIRVEFFGDDVERITEIDTLTGEILKELEEIEIFPAKHYITPQEKLQRAIGDIEKEMTERIEFFKSTDKLLEAQRIEQRTRYDLEMLREVGITSGIENYSRVLEGRPAGTPPFTLLDYFPDDYLLVIDESHMSIPQIGGMYNGDQARKGVLVDYGFRLPSAMDNRPLKFDEFEKRFTQAVYVSATPGPYELSHSATVAEQVIRPTGLVDPQIEVKPVKGQVDDLIAQIRERTARGERALVTTLTKRMAEDLTEYLQEIGIKVQYLHSEVQTVERIEILRDLRAGLYDVVVGINLLREGLDLPEVSLVAILDADKEGFLRSQTSLVQTIGRAARHVEGKVILYADTMTKSMTNAIAETDRRREKQVTYNTEHGIEPKSIVKAIRDLTDRVKSESHTGEVEYATAKPGHLSVRDLPKSEAEKILANLEIEMKAAAKDLEFEKAALLRDQILELRQQLLDIDDKTPEWEKVRKMGDLMDDGDAPEGEKGRKGEGAKKPVEYVIKKPIKGKPGKARERTRK